MQPSGRAVTSHPASLSLYNSALRILPGTNSSSSSSSSSSASNHSSGSSSHRPSPSDRTWSPSSPIIFSDRSAGRDYTWQNGSRIVFSQPAVQRRSASSSSRSSPPPPPPPSAKRNLEYRRPSDRVFRRTPTKPQNPNDLGALNLDLDSLLHSTSRTNKYAPAHRSSSPSHATQTASAPLPANLSSEDVASGTTTPAQTAVNPAKRATEAASSRDREPEPERIERSKPEITQELDTSLAEEPPSETSPFSGAQDPVDDFIATLEQRNHELERLNRELEQSAQEARNAVESITQRTADVAKQLDQTNTKLEIETRRALVVEQRLQNTNQKLKTEFSARIGQMERELADERKPVNQYKKRLAAITGSNVRFAEADRQLKEKEDRLAVRKDYQTFRDIFVAGNKILISLISEYSSMSKELDHLQRRKSYWSKALDTFKSFDAETRVKDDFRQWDLSAYATKNNLSLEERNALADREADQLEHRDAVFAETIEFLQTRIIQSDQLIADYRVHHRQLYVTFERWKRVAHWLRKTTKLVRYDMDPANTSPLMGARERFLTVVSTKFSQEARRLQLGFNESKFEIKQLERVGADRGLIFAKRRALETIEGACAAIMLCGQAWSDLSLAQWLPKQPLYQQVYWNEVGSIQASAASIQRRSETAVEALRKSGLPREHQIMQNMSSVFKFRDTSKKLEFAAFKLALFKSDQGQFAEQELSKLQEELRLNYESKLSAMSTITKSMRKIEGFTKEISASRAQSRRTEVADHLQSMTLSSRRERRKALRNSSTTKLSENVAEAAAPQAEIAHAKSQTKRKQELIKAIQNKMESARAEVERNEKFAAALEADSTTLDADDATQAASDNKSELSDSSIAPRSPDQTSSKTTGSQADHEDLESTSFSSSANPGPAWKERTTKSERRPNASSGVSAIRPRSRVLPKPHFKQRLSPKMGFKPTGRKDQDNRQTPASFVEQAVPREGQEMPKALDENVNCQPTENVAGIPSLVPSNKNDDEFKPLLFQIPPKDFRDTLMMSNASQASYWRYSLYKSPDGKKPTRYYCRKFDQAERAAQWFINEKVLGFDIEWEMGSKVGQGSIKENVSLIQIACDDRIALFQIASFYGDTAEELMPPTLKKILESPNVIKAGVNIAGDFTRLRKCLGVDGQGIFELSHLYKLVKYSEKEPTKVNKSPAKLADQVQDILFLPLAKGHVRTSSWSKELSGEQIDYACSDAYAGFKLFHALDVARKEMHPAPPRPAFWELDMPIVLGNGEVADDARKRSKAMAKKASQEQAGTSSLTAEEEQAVNDEEEEAEAEAEDAEPSSNEEALAEPTHKESSGEKASVAGLDYPEAEFWVQQWQDTLPPERKGKNVPTSLRAYALWHHQGLRLEQVAEAMRQPPLALSTVSSYVLEVVRTENLPFEMERLQQAVNHVPMLTRWKYRGLLQKKEGT